MATRRLTIYGRVQGVCYRDWAVQTAVTLGLTGWVRNRMDESVEAVVSGAPDAIQCFIALARKGPWAARVERIDINEESEGAFHGFERRPTV